MKFLMIFPLLLLFTLQLSGAPAVAEEYPAASEAAPLAGEIAAEAIQVQERLDLLLDTTALTDQLVLAAASFRDLQLRVQTFGDPGSWHIDRLLDTRSQLVRERLKLDALAKRLTSRQEDVAAIRLDWEARQLFWRGWEKRLAGETAQWPKEVFQRVQMDIGQLLGSAATTAERLDALQEEQTAILNESLGMLVRVETALRQARGEIYQRSGPPLLAPEFFEQFQEDWREEFQSGLKAALHLDLRALHGQLWILVIQVLLVLATATFIRSHRHTADGEGEWGFIVQNPWATGIFVAMAALTPLYKAPPGLLRLAVWILFAFSAAVLISALVRNPLKRFTVFLLATVLLVSLVLQVINLPTPLYRIYVTGVGLTGLTLSLLLARYNIVRHQGTVNAFTVGLRLAALVCLVIFMAQLAGFDTLATRLLDASIKSVFIGIFALMTIHLGKGAIDYLLGKPLLAKRAFVQRYGAELGRRLKGILFVLVIVGALFNILLVLGVYHSFSHAMEALASRGIFVGQVQVTVPMLLLALLVIYLSIQTSWVLRATLDTQIFPHSSADRGVRDAIKKLLHYFLIFIGFLLAMGLAGIELRNFAVLAGAFGIGIGFGLQNIVNNFVSGLILLFERPVKV
ncbi:MAG: mechanosensitive ion channel, partial [Desulfuromonadales bacterium]|nr:mechanosensitive ion channel [Desulfuromonadales bacterium]